MVAQPAAPAAPMAAVSSSGEEPEPEMSSEPAAQEQAASSMETMMALLLQEVGGVKGCRHRRGEYLYPLREQSRRAGLGLWPRIQENHEGGREHARVEFAQELH